MGMDRMYRMLSFWLLMMTLMFLAGEMYTLAGLFLFQTLVFLVLGLFRLTERTYMYIFGVYMVMAFVTIVFWSFFMVGV